MLLLPLAVAQAAQEASRDGGLPPHVNMLMTSCIDSVKKPMGHFLRSHVQADLLVRRLQALSRDSVWLIADWKMKMNPTVNSESQGAFFGKVGICNDGFCILRLWLACLRAVRVSQTSSRESD